ncbi:MAG: hypothetical protein HYV27_11315 [Candidatus Hydrogenedentes bacterium]|nr:hypothetical protein [Candidatus Hydrogenedentota bacterium]
MRLPEAGEAGPGLLANSRVWGGCLAWCAFAVLAVVLRGVRWEETYEHALLITRAVPMPEGHPMFQYVRNVFSLQSYLTAGILWLSESPMLICGLRNVLQLVFATVPVFLLASLFTRQTRYGHLAALLVLCEVHKPLESYYPIVPWPHFFATGQIGLGCALLVLFLQLAGYWRSAWCGLALLAGMHLGQLPPLLVYFGLHGLYAVYARQWGRVRQALAGFFAGLIPIVLFYAILRFFHVPEPLGGAYAVTGDVQGIYGAYTALHDLHRAVPRLNPLLHSVVATAILAAVLVLRRSAEPQTYGSLLAYLAIVGAIVAIFAALQQVTADAPVFLVIGWMPYRLMNHLAVLLLPVIVAVLAAPRTGHGLPPDRWGEWVLLFLLLFAAAQPMLAWVLPVALVERYLGTPEALLFLLLGAAWGAAWCRHAPAHAKVIAAGALAFALISLAFIHQYGAFLMATGAGAAAVPRRLFPLNGLASRWEGRLLAAVGILLACSLLARQHAHREHLPVADIEVDTVRLLAERGEAEAMLLVPWWDIGWLGCTRHPVFADYQTAHLMSYLPRLAPAIKAMHAEVYGWVVDRPETGPPLESWPTRTPLEWQRLGEKWGFGFVLSPVEIPLQLPKLLETPPYALYEVPGIPGK